MTLQFVLPATFTTQCFLRVTAHPQKRNCGPVIVLNNVFILENVLYKTAVAGAFIRAVLDLEHRLRTGNLEIQVCEAINSIAYD